MKGRWQRHKANVCGGAQAKCWYCEHPPVGPTPTLVKAAAKKIKYTRRGWKMLYQLLSKVYETAKAETEMALIKPATLADMEALATTKEGA